MRIILICFIQTCFTLKNLYFYENSTILAFNKLYKDQVIMYQSLNNKLDQFTVLNTVDLEINNFFLIDNLKLVLVFLQPFTVVMQNINQNKQASQYSEGDLNQHSQIEINSLLYNVKDQVKILKNPKENAFFMVYTQELEQKFIIFTIKTLIKDFTILIDSVIVDNSTVKPIDCTINIDDKIVCIGSDQFETLLLFTINEPREQKSIILNIRFDQLTFELFQKSVQTPLNIIWLANNSYVISTNRQIEFINFQIFRVIYKMIYPPENNSYQQVVVENQLPYDKNISNLKVINNASSLLYLIYSAKNITDQFIVYSQLIGSLIKPFKYPILTKNENTHFNQYLEEFYQTSGDLILITYQSSNITFTPYKVCDQLESLIPKKSTFCDIFDEYGVYFVTQPLISIIQFSSLTNQPQLSIKLTTQIDRLLCQELFQGFRLKISNYSLVNQIDISEQLCIDSRFFIQDSNTINLTVIPTYDQFWMKEINLYLTTSKPFKNIIVMMEYQLSKSLKYPVSKEINVLAQINWLIPSVQQIENMRSFSKGINNPFFNWISYLGLIPLIMNTPQEIGQLILLNYATPLNVYYFEVAIASFVFPGPFPDWEDFPAYDQYFLFYSSNLTDDVIQNQFELIRFDRIKLTYQFIFNTQFPLLFASLIFFATFILSFIKKKPKRLPQEQQQFIKQQIENNLSGNVAYPQLLDEFTYPQYHIYHTYKFIDQKFKNESQYAQYSSFLLTWPFIEGKFSLFTISIFLAIYGANFDTAFNVISLLYALLFFQLMLYSYIGSAIELAKIYNIATEEISQKQQFLKDNLRLYLLAEYRFYLWNKKQAPFINLISTHLFLLKKYIFALVIVFGYGNINWQIPLLIIIHLQAVIFKLIFTPYYLKFTNIITSVGDISLTIALGLKLNDFHNLNKANDISEFESWTNQGWLTIFFEIIYIAAYLINTVYSYIYYLRNLKKKVVFEDSNLKEIELKEFKEVPEDLDLKANLTDEKLIKEELIQQDQSTPYDLDYLNQYKASLYTFQKVRVIPNKLKDYESNIKMLLFDQFSTLGYFERYSSLFRDGVIHFNSSIRLKYNFKISDKVVYFEENRVIYGEYTFYLENPCYFKSIYKGIKINDNFEKAPELILKSQQFKQKLYFYKKFEEVQNRKVELLLEDEEKKYAIQLCGNDLLLMEGRNIENEDFQIEGLFIYKYARFIGSNNKIFHLVDQFDGILMEGEDTQEYRMKFRYYKKESQLGKLQEIYLSILNNQEVKMLLDIYHVEELKYLPEEEILLESFFQSVINFIKA